MAVDWTISVGVIIQTLLLLIGVGGFASAAVRRAALVDYRLTAVERSAASSAEELSGIAKTLAMMSQQDTRIERIEKTLDEIRHGEGYVLPLKPARRDFSGAG